MSKAELKRREKVIMELTLRLGTCPIEDFGKVAKALFDEKEALKAALAEGKS